MNQDRKIRLCSVTFWLSFSIAASALLLWCAKHAYQSLNPKHVLLLEAAVLFALALHIKKDAHNPHCVSDALELRSPKANWDIRYDYIRLFAVLAVILMHCMDVAMPFLSLEITDETFAELMSVPKKFLYGAAILRTFLYLGNTSFLMLTGALTLGRRADEDLLGFYRKSFSRILLPLFIYFVFYMWQNGELYPLHLGVLRTIAHRFLVGDYEAEAPFFWFIYIIVSIYISIPFLRFMLQGMSYRMLSKFAGLIFFFYILRIYFSCSAYLLPFFCDWIGLPIIGLWVVRPETRRYDRFIWIAAILAAVKTALAVNPYAYLLSYVNYYIHFAPPSILTACGIFALALHKKPARAHKLEPIVVMLSRRSYTMLLLHWWALYHIVGMTWQRTLSWQEPLDFAVSVLLVIAVSLVSGVLIDQTLVFIVRSLCDWALKEVQTGLDFLSSPK